MVVLARSQTKIARLLITEHVAFAKVVLVQLHRIRTEPAWPAGSADAHAKAIFGDRNMTTFVECSTTGRP
uniref:Uncharacterized protein n=1 Tax=Marseillevirus LCMAC103 TaxID=2506604 RepID=A0A481YW14_9VIRU|nr:MAG: hypothetical protein LCMAC103_00250 [Marseillevirus LCMAC103]